MVPKSDLGAFWSDCSELSFCCHFSEEKKRSLEVGFYNFTIGDEVTDSNKSLRPLRESLRRSDEGGVVFF